jgi:hypothetical protein
VGGGCARRRTRGRAIARIDRDRRAGRGDDERETAHLLGSEDLVVKLLHHRGELRLKLIDRGNVRHRRRARAEALWCPRTAPPGR